MAFVRKKVKTFKWPVEVQEPSDKKPGKFEKSEFTAIFKRVKMSELEGVSESEGVSQLKKVLVGWEGIKDEDGDEIEIDAEAQTISVVIDDDTLERRRENWKQPKPYTDRGVLAKYARLVSSASLGAVTD